MFDGQCFEAVGLVPIRRSLMQRSDDVRFALTQLCQEKLAIERVIPIPLSFAIERDQEQALRLYCAQLGSRSRGFQDRLAQRRVKAIEDCRAAKKPLQGAWVAGERFAVQVVGHVPVVAPDRLGLAPVLLGDQCGEKQPDRPTLGTFGHGCRRLVRRDDLCVGKDLPGAGRVEC